MIQFILKFKFYVVWETCKGFKRAFVVKKIEMTQKIKDIITEDLFEY